MQIRFLGSVFAAAAILSVCCAETLLAAEPRVDLELVLEGGLVGTDSRTWSEMLNRAGFSSVRIKSDGSDSPSIQTMGTAAAPAYRVVAILTPANQLLLPKGRFGPNDRAGIEGWLRKLRDGGEEAINIKPAAFGLLPKQLVAVHEALAVPVQFSTLGKPPREVAKKIADGLSLKFLADDASQRALASDEPVGDELEGIASGAALAAILRPLGLVMFPAKNGSELRLRIASTKNAKEHWPVGWPPQGNPSETLPELFKFLKVDIGEAPLAEAAAAIAGRVKAPLLWDHNAIARDSISLDKKVTLSEPNTFYGRALDRLLQQARLKYEIRVDEAEKPLLWITSLKQ